MTDPIEIVNNDPDQFACYSDHEHDISYKGECDWCGSTDPGVVGHVLPDVKRMKGVDPVKAAAIVMQTKTATIFDGILLDLFTASAIDGVAKALSDSARAKLRTMNLLTAATVCLKLAG